MGKTAEQLRLTKEAEAQHYADAPGPITAREALDAREAQESADALQLDLMAEKLRAAGCPAKDALRYVGAVVAVIQAKDKACAEDVMGAVGGGGALLGRDEGASILAKQEALEALRVMAIKLVQAPKPRFSAGCFLLAAGIDYAGIRSQRDWAAQQQMSPEHASNEVLEWQKAMGLPKNAGQKSEAATKNYQNSNGRIKDEL